MSDLPPDDDTLPPVGDPPPEQQDNHQISMEDFVRTADNFQMEVNPGGELPKVPPLVDFILGQLQPIEQVGFLRGSIIWLSSRIGTPDGRTGDVNLLDAFNVAFQTRLRDMQIEQQHAMSDQKNKQEAVQLQANAEAKARGFESAAHMQSELGQLYSSVSERINAWHAATEPGADVTSAPDEQALLYDVYRIVNGLSR